MPSEGPQSMSAVLQVSGLRVHYGAIEAVKDIDLMIARGRITALLGANGAGKSTTLLALSGLLRASAGSILFDGAELREEPPHRIVERGLIQIPEGREILATLSVRENLLLGAYRRRGQDELKKDFDQALALFPRLGDKLSGRAGDLSGGEQQMLAIARGLMARPRCLLLDEPSMGLAPLLVRDIFKILKRLNDHGLTILLVEQNVHEALRVAHEGYVMENGEIAMSGSSKELLNNPRVIEAYLGA
jgi:branched-chain amino acid transport system ATP-binding protein